MRNALLCRDSLLPHICCGCAGALWSFVGKVRAVERGVILSGGQILWKENMEFTSDSIFPKADGLQASGVTINERGRLQMVLKDEVEQRSE